MKARTSTRSKSPATKSKPAKAKAPAAKTKAKAPAAKAKAKAPAAKAKAPAAKAKAKAPTKAKAPAAKAKAPAKAKTPAAKAKAPAKAAAPTTERTYTQRADFGAPADSFFSKQPAPIRVILEDLRGLVESELPDARSSLKWGMPVYSIGKQNVVSLGAHRAHVNLIFWGSPDAYDDPAGLLSPPSKMGRHLKITSLDDLPRNAIRGWLETAARRARAAA